MKARFWITMLAAMVALAIGSTDFAFGRGGRGGGGGGGGGFGGGGGVRGGGGGIGGGGGGARPSGGGFSGGARPSVGSSPSFSRPSGGGGGTAAARPSAPSTRPSPGAGSRPNVGGGNIGGGNAGAGNKPNVGAGAGSRPSTLPATRPGAGAGQGIGSGQGIANRPGAGQGITTRPGAGAGQGIANRPGISNQPARLPGLGDSGAGSRLPNQGANRPQTLEGRQGDLSNRMSSGRENWQNNRHDFQGNHQDWHGGADINIHNHGDWYHGCWHGGGYAGAGWNNLWNNYPAAAAFGLTAWGVNRMAYGFGYWGYANPYYVSSESSGYDYSQPLVVYADSGTSAAPADAAAPPATVDAGTDALNAARAAFHDGDSAKALMLLDTAVKATPNDTALHEFRGLVLFSLKKYSESAAATYAVLSAGPGWDWTTMIGLYSSVDVYTEQLRTLENFAKANPKSPDAHFLLGYQYLSTGYAETALKQFKLAQVELPNDKLIAQLVGMTTPPEESAKTATPPEPADVPAEKVLSAEKLVGSWKASSQGAEFQLDIAKDGGFVWTYSRGNDKQTMKGVFAVDQNNLALEPETGGTMLAELDFAKPSQFLFKMIGGDAKDPGLEFKKS